MTTLAPFRDARHDEAQCHRYSTGPEFLDRFWDAVFIEPPSQTHIYDASASSDPLESSLPIMPKQKYESVMDRSNITSDATCTAEVPVRLPSNNVGCALRTTLKPPQNASTTKPSLRNRCTSKLSARLPRLTIQPELKPPQSGHGIKSPATAILAMASHFLDDIVKITNLKSSNANTVIVGSPEGRIEIEESEVLVDVIDDERQAGVQSAVEVQSYNVLEKLEIPFVSTLTIPEDNYNMQTADMLNGPVESAEELDALLQMNWERQLSNINAPFWY